VSSSLGRPSLVESLRSTAPAWLASRALVLGAYLAAMQAVAHGWLSKASAQARIDQGLLGWDAGWYRAIAAHGYGGLGRESTRFFPLWPELARGVHLLGVPLPWVLVGGASLLWWGALIGVDQLGWALGIEVRRRTLAVWLMCLSPGAIASMLGYSEPLLVLLVASAMVLIYREGSKGSPSLARWSVIAVLGVLAGATRPVGVLLAIPIAIEAWRSRGRAITLVVQAAAVLSPLVGMGAYLLWARNVFGDALLPFRVQTESGHHGSLADPVSGIIHGLSLAAHGHLSALLHLPWVVLAIVALVAGIRRLPASASVYGAAIVLVALGGQNLDSFERYLLAAPTIFFVVAGWLGARWLRVGTLVVLSALLVGTSILVFADYLVP